MNLLQFIKNYLFSKFSRKDLTDRLNTITQKLNEVVLPSLEDIRANAILLDPISPYGKSWIGNFLKILPSSMRNRSKNPTFGIIHQSMSNVGKLIQLLTEHVGKELPEQIYIEGITYQRAVVLRLIELLDFTVDYSSKQLNYYCTSENMARTSQKHGVLPFTKAEETVIISQQDAFFKAIELFYADPKMVMEQIHRIPEVLVDVHETIPREQTSLDPLKLNLIPVISPFLLFIGERKVDWEYERYERAKKERQMIVLNIEFMERHAGGQPMDARNETILNGYKSELVLIRDRIAKMEEKAMR